MGWRIGGEAARGLLELAFAPRAVATARLVPRNRDVDEPLEEVALARRRRAPLELELLVRGEVLAPARISSSPGSSPFRRILAVGPAGATSRGACRRSCS